MPTPSPTRLSVLLASCAILAACGGGGGDDKSSPSPTPTPAPAPAPAPSPTSGFGAASPSAAGIPPAGVNGCPTTGSSYQVVGRYKVYNGDCVASVTVSSTQWNAIIGNENQLDIAAFTRDFSLTFKDAFDFLVLVLDTGTDSPPSGYSFYGRYRSWGTRVPTRTRTLMGTLVLPYLSGGAPTAFDSGPSLHELAHEWANNGVIPSADAGHWGFSSAGGQLGGFAAVYRHGNTTDQFQGYGPAACVTAETNPSVVATQRIPCAKPMKGFGTNANGGNEPKYSALERFVMGLLPAGRLEPIQVFNNAVMIDQREGIFKAPTFNTFTEADIISRLGNRYVPYERSQKQFRIATLVVTPNESLNGLRLERLNKDLTNFTMDGYPSDYIFDHGSNAGGTTSGKVYYGNNFFTATDGVARLRAHGLLAERR